VRDDHKTFELGVFTAGDGVLLVCGQGRGGTGIQATLPAHRGKPMGLAQPPGRVAQPEHRKWYGREAFDSGSRHFSRARRFMDLSWLVTGSSDKDSRFGDTPSRRRRSAAKVLPATPVDQPGARNI
jgi:hypothetical protein